MVDFATAILLAGGTLSLLMGFTAASLVQDGDSVGDYINVKFFWAVVIVTLLAAVYVEASV